MRPQAKVRRVDLVRIDHPEYVEEMSRQAAAHRRLGPRADPGDLYRASGIVETAVRSWLGERLPLLDTRVIDAELLPAGERAYVRRFLELDAVIGAGGTPERVVEMKFSSSGGAVRRGLGQLARARDLLSQRWPGVTGLLVLVEANRTGVELDIDRLREVDVVRPESLARRDGHAPMTLLVLTVTDLAEQLDDAARALVERGHDEGDALTAARVARAALDVKDVDDGVETGRLRPHTDPGDPPSVTFDGGADDDPGSPFAALAGWRIEPRDDDEDDQGD